MPLNTTMTLPVKYVPVSQTRNLEQLVAGRCSCSSTGVKLKRVLTQCLQRRLDPFLMFDAFGRDAQNVCREEVADHPHCGHEIVTYMIAGRMRFRDHAGRESTLEPGGVQWLTAGCGVIHTEIPQQEDGVMEGFQFWLNVPGPDKTAASKSCDFAAEDLVRFTTSAGVRVTVIAGESHGVKGAVTREATAPLILDLQLPAGSRFEQKLPKDHNAFIFTYRGSVTIAGQEIPAHNMGILANDPQSDGVVVEAAVDARVLLLAGRPLKEPIAQYGAFVMNTQKEIYQALSDYRCGRLGQTPAETSGT